MPVSSREVLRCLLEGVQGLAGPQTPVRVAGRSGISQARTRLGSEPVKQLHDRLVGPIAGRDTRGAWFGKWRLVGLDGTNILDPQQAPAEQLAVLYHERWEIEAAFDELKTHLKGSRIVLRSKTPDLVKQELHGLLMAHFAVRGLMHEAAVCEAEEAWGSGPPLTLTCSPLP